MHVPRRVSKSTVHHTKLSMIGHCSPTIVSRNRLSRGSLGSIYHIPYYPVPPKHQPDGRYACILIACYAKTPVCRKHDKASPSIEYIAKQPTLVCVRLARRLLAAGHTEYARLPDVESGVHGNLLATTGLRLIDGMDILLRQTSRGLVMSDRHSG
jgi:hypothetical protein